MAHVSALFFDQLLDVFHAPGHCLVFACACGFTNWLPGKARPLPLSEHFHQVVHRLLVIFQRGPYCTVLDVIDFLIAEDVVQVVVPLDRLNGAVLLLLMGLRHVLIDHALLPLEVDPAEESGLTVLLRQCEAVLLEQEKIAILIDLLLRHIINRQAR